MTMTGKTDALLPAAAFRPRTGQDHDLTTSSGFAECMTQGGAASSTLADTPLPGLLADMFAALNGDGDGQISSAERASARAMLAACRVPTGPLPRQSEARPLIDPVEVAFQSLFALADQNKDGTADAAELESLSQEAMAEADRLQHALPGETVAETSPLALLARFFASVDAPAKDGA